IGAKIREYLSTGQLAVLEERRSRVPAAALKLMQIPGIGPKRAMQFAQELNVQTVADLQAALDSGQIAALPRLGDKAAEALRLELQRIESLRSVEDLAQLLALWKPGVYSKEREEAYFDARER